MGLISFALLFCYLAYQEGTICARASPARTVNTPEYVHERYQRSYFNAQDAQKLRRLHGEQVIALFGIIGCAFGGAVHKRQVEKRAA